MVARRRTDVYVSAPTSLTSSAPTCWEAGRDEESSLQIAGVASHTLALPTAIILFLDAILWQMLTFAVWVTVQWVYLGEDGR